LFFEKDDMISLRILDVVELKQGQISRHVSGRQFHALSYRMCSDVWLKTSEQTLHVQENAMCFVPAGLEYERSGTRDELIAVHVEMPETPENRIEILYPRSAALMRELFGRILACWKARENGYQYQCLAILYEILAHCRRQTVQSQPQDRIQPSVDYLEQNWNHPELTIGEIAKQSFMSEVYFRKLFKARFGLSPVKYLAQLRVEKAAELIHTGYYTLRETASLCGYLDYKYFSVEFKRVKGCTPSEYAAMFY